MHLIFDYKTEKNLMWSINRGSVNNLVIVLK